MWLYSRHELFGDYFCGLGRLNCVSYQKVAEIMSDKQLRDTFVGRARMDGGKFPDHFLLFENTAGNGESHAYHRQFMIDAFFNSAAVQRANDSYAKALCAQMAKDLHEAKQDVPFHTPNLVDSIKLQFPEKLLGDFVIKWMHYACLGIKLDELEEVDFEAFRKTMSEGGYVKRRIAGVGSCMDCTGQGQKAESHIIDIYLKYGMSEEVKLGETYYGMSSDELAEYFLSMISIAATLGGMNLLAASLNAEILSTVKPPASDPALQSFILEAARRWSPVGSINVLLPEARTVQIAGKDQTFPAGTVVAANLALASLDERQFECPFQFQANRSELAKRTISFNAVGLDPSESCPYGPHGKLRVCPGRSFGLTMTKEVLRAYHGLS